MSETPITGKDSRTHHYHRDPWCRPLHSSASCLDTSARARRDSRRNFVLWGMGRDQLKRLLGRIRRALRIERRFTLEESYELLELSEAIIDHGRMHQSYYKSPVAYVMVETKELAFRLRETPETIEDALRLLQVMGRAEPYDQSGRWKLRLAKEVDRGDAASA
jgi:hypothetical protein